MKLRMRFPIVLATAAVLLAAGLALWPALPANRSARAALSALTPGQNAAIRTANLLLLGDSPHYQIYLPGIKR